MRASRGSRRVLRLQHSASRERKAPQERWVATVRRAPREEEKKIAAAALEAKEPAVRTASASCAAGSEQFAAEPAEPTAHREVEPAAWEKRTPERLQTGDGIPRSVEVAAILFLCGNGAQRRREERRREVVAHHLFLRRLSRRRLPRVWERRLEQVDSSWRRVALDLLS